VEPTVLDESVSRHPKSIAAMAARLKLTRRALGLSQAELCRRADLSRNTYNQWERGRGRPDVHYVIRLCEAFDITLDWIFRGETRGLPAILAGMVLATSQPLAASALAVTEVVGNAAE
jgi:transcriptional regulator with XRE-family HTH domain